MLTRTRRNILVRVFCIEEEAGAFNLHGSDYCAVGRECWEWAILWNTRYLDAAPMQLRTEGATVNDADVVRLSPLSNAHIHMQGRYHFTMQEAARYGQLRPLHTADPTDFDARNR